MCAGLRPERKAVVTIRQPPRPTPTFPKKSISDITSHCYNEVALFQRKR